MGDMVQNVDEYIAAAPAETRELLCAVRETIRQAAPNAEELIRYGMPAYYVGGHPVVHFAAQKKHIGFHPGTESINSYREKLEGYTCTKGCIHFPYDKPIDHALIAEITGIKAAGMAAKGFSR